MSDSTLTFSVGPHPDGEGAMIVFTMANGMTSTVVMRPDYVRQLIGLLEVVVPNEQ
jgi:hypothetical protein